MNCLIEKSNKYNEKNDCSVRAVATILQTSYEDSHNMHKKFGRKDGGGTPWKVTKNLLEYRGFNLEIIKIPKYVRTIKHLENSGIIDRGMFLIHTSRHIAGCVDGEIKDHIAGRRHRPIILYKVIPTENAVYSKKASIQPIKKRKRMGYKYALIHKETKEVFHMYKVFRSETRKAIEEGHLYIKGRKKETLGNLEMVEL